MKLERERARAGEKCKRETKKLASDWGGPPMNRVSAVSTWYPEQILDTLFGSTTTLNLSGHDVTITTSRPHSL